MWSCRFFHYDQQPKRSQLCKRDWAAVHWRAPKVSKASLESSCPGHIQSARCLQNIPDLLCTPWTVTRALESWSVAWICHLCIVSMVQYDPKPLDWLWIRGTTLCYIYCSLENPTQDHCCFTNHEKEEYVKVRVISLLIPSSWTKDRQVDRCLALAVSTCRTCSW